jgi:hypothetical protein
LKYLEEDARDHGHTSLAMAKDFPPGVKRHIVVYDLLNTTLLEIASKDRRKTHSLGLY